MKTLTLSAIICIACLTGCKDETISGYVDPDVTWVLTEINGAPFKADAELSFPSQGRIKGKAPCNGFMSTQTAPYPWFEIGPIAATKMACDALKDEDMFFGALRKMTVSEAFLNSLILSNDQGDQMVFTAQ